MTGIWIIARAAACVPNIVRLRRLVWLVITNKVLLGYIKLYEVL